MKALYLLLISLYVCTTVCKILQKKKKKNLEASDEIPWHPLGIQTENKAQFPP